MIQRGLVQLKREVDRRKAHEHEFLEMKRQLEESNQRWLRLSWLDMTGVTNGRRFKEFFNQEWTRAIRESKPLSMALCDAMADEPEPCSP